MGLLGAFFVVVFLVMRLYFKVLRRLGMRGLVGGGFVCFF